MLKADNLREFRPTYKYTNGDAITLATVEEAITSAANNYAIPVAFENDQIKSGGMFNSTTDDCLVLFHPEHPRDYFRFCISIKRQGAFAFVSIRDFGESKQLGKQAHAEAAKADRKGQSLSYKLGSMAVSGLMTLGKNKQKLEEEQCYYDALVTIFDEIVS